MAVLIFILTYTIGGAVMFGLGFKYGCWYEGGGWVKRSMGAELLRRRVRGAGSEPEIIQDVDGNCGVFGDVPMEVFSEGMGWRGPPLTMADVRARYDGDAAAGD